MIVGYWLTFVKYLLRSRGLAAANSPLIVTATSTLFRSIGDFRVPRVAASISRVARLSEATMLLKEAKLALAIVNAPVLALPTKVALMLPV